MPKIVSRLKALWSGELPLRDAFWDYAVFWGVLINLAASMASLGLVLVMRHLPAFGNASVMMAPLAFAIHVVPLPYNVIALVGVWRSASDPTLPVAASVLARAATLALFVLFLVI